MKIKSKLSSDGSAPHWMISETCGYSSRNFPVDAGYQYRSEGWVNESYTCSSSARPKNVTQGFVTVNEAWWGSFQYRAFNLSHIGSKTAVTAADNTHFRIYVPIS